MGAAASPVRKGAVVLAVIMAPIGIHVAMATQRGTWRWLASLVIARESGLIGWIALSFVRIRSLRWIGSSGGAGVNVYSAIWRTAPDGVVASFLPSRTRSPTFRC